MNGPIRAALVGAALIVTTAANAAAPLSSLHLIFKETLTRPKGKPESRKSQMWLKSNKMRVEQGNLTIVVDGKKSYMFSPQDPQKRMQVVDIPASQQNGSIIKYIDQMIGPLLKQMKKVGETQVKGYPVDIYQGTDTKLNISRKAWVATTVGAPVFMKEETRIPAGVHLIEVTDIQVNAPLADRLFTPPTGYKIVKAPPMPAGKMPVAPKSPKR